MNVAAKSLFGTGDAHSSLTALAPPTNLSEKFLLRSKAF